MQMSPAMFSDSTAIDFAGPICRLFPDGSSKPVADELRETVDRFGAGDVLTADQRAACNNRNRALDAADISFLRLVFRRSAFRCVRFARRRRRIARST